MDIRCRMNAQYDSQVQGPQHQADAEGGRSVVVVWCVVKKGKMQACCEAKQTARSRSLSAEPITDEPLFATTFLCSAPAIEILN
jgi:hypothetical protein